MSRKKKDPDFTRIIDAIYAAATQECKSNELLQEIRITPTRMARFIAERVRAELETDYKSAEEVVLETRRAAFVELRRRGPRVIGTPSMSRTEANAKRTVRASRTMWLAERIAARVAELLKVEPRPSPPLPPPVPRRVRRQHMVKVRLTRLEEPKVSFWAAVYRRP